MVTDPDRGQGRAAISGAMESSAAVSMTAAGRGGGGGGVEGDGGVISVAETALLRAETMTKFIYV